MQFHERKKFDLFDFTSFFSWIFLYFLARCVSLSIISLQWRMNATITRHSQLTSQLLISSFDAVTLRKVFLEVKSKVKKNFYGSQVGGCLVSRNHKDHHMHCVHCALCTTSALWLNNNSDSKSNLFKTNLHFDL